ncbi:membrane protein insertion efficiency factor YidD [Mesonia sp. HuA40]|uniref:membrane protein insertion efficiency factor YidD n=1 Tax=Mesonia sp. HuA40 TaxID=2602761 RepID=UPI0011CCD892|nr:membrane protein insertion efficiency factor YidD [Mesonia sp. HuA40]TXK75267.1 membrane protein insertion efficiency factor YidD [Mesonia sp. HuA40]
MIKKILIVPLLALIWLYKKFISPLTPATCRFQPTCSSYAQEALKKHGLFKGGYLGFKRILKCHPWGKSGYDPVP